MNRTIEYYNNHAAEYCASTQYADMNACYGKFMKYLKAGGRILDAGCGSGRDSRYFLDKGFQVTAFDASSEMCRYASAYIGQSVLCRTFEEMHCQREFDAIWACASLLHVSKQEMPFIIANCFAALKDNGIMYASFKYGAAERITDERFFNDYNEQEIDGLFQKIKGFEILECFITGNVRKERSSGKWLNVIVRKRH